MFHREGKSIILFSTIIFLCVFFYSQYNIENELIQRGIQIVIAVFLFLILQFFRNPKRNTPLSLDSIISPCDGKVVVVEEVYENEFFEEQMTQVSIFMSPINVHVTRYPVSGSVLYSKYHPGKYLVAWHPKSSTLNERTTVAIKTPKFGRIGYRQIAGALARRIVNYAIKGDKVAQGTDAGFIKFGSRIDLLLPTSAVINVKIGQRVVGGETVIATSL
ncbi:MAG: phosphatidylserine decarboxylase family protein [Flavobacteriaceae bacterium]|nr:phosphatidylserine decarboxylase family protein [Flavobacteriaceae bacterium]OUX39054.1 MAG: phosphatidylserine decarboxylase [Flavobacteriaceae bacterium TMED265]